MASKLKLWNKFGRFITGIVVVCFFLPFFGVSCQGMDVVTVSGADMVGGCKPGGLIAAAADEDKGHRGGGEMGGLDAKMDNVDREPLAIVALALALLAAGFAWVRSRNALKAALALSIAGLGTLGALYVHMNSKIDDAIKTESATKASSPTSSIHDDIAKDVSAGSRFGFWLVAIGLGSVAVITGMALREKDTPTPT